jgi:hypothetical protein
MLGWQPGAMAGNETISYNNQIAPILSEHCFHCHGPDSAARKPKKLPLRLDKPDFAFAPRDDGKPVIIKGDPGASELVRRITATDDDVMPPASEREPLSAAEIDLLKRWIGEGGKYEKHWSLIPPVRPLAPDDGAGWANNPIDHFVAHKLAQNGLKPNPAEERARLYRRLSFDLTGLPPKPAEMEAFVRSGSDTAYEKAVDRMLRSDASAEQFTRYWLDAVRYADTQGIHHDHARSIWPYRDWVIRAFKNNMPFDQFTLEQIAGDMLPDATMDQKIASGYNRLLPTTGEGGAIAPEYAAIYAKDRTDTTSAVWLGLTMGCATCHDHKFDPISTKDYYSMTAFFRNNTCSILDNPSGANNAPFLFVPRDADRARWKKLEDALAKQEQMLSNRRSNALGDFNRWMAEAGAHPEGLEPKREPFLRLSLAGAGGLEKDSVTGPFGPGWPVMPGEIVKERTPVIERKGKAAFGAFVYLDGKPNGCLMSRMDADNAYRGWDLFLSDGRPTVHIVDQFPDTALKVTANDELKPDMWHHVMAVFDGALAGSNAISLYVDGIKSKVTVDNNNLGSNIVAKVPFMLGGRAKKKEISDKISDGKAYLQDVRFYNKALSGEEVAHLAAEGLARSFVAENNITNRAATSNALVSIFLDSFDQSAMDLKAGLERLTLAEDAVRERGGGDTLVIEEKKDSTPSAHVLIRGVYTSEGEAVTADTPAGVMAMGPDMPHNRLGLAKWIVSRQNPLTARVTVNRLWAELFGLGLVETTEDFGVMGSRPSNQPLLDWLAVEFVDSGWDFRHMVKLMVMSQTYRQSAKISPEKEEKDPRNILCSRGPHYRLDAEEIRDEALAASGLLVPVVGGPTVKPYQPEGIWETVAMKDSTTRVYHQDTGEGLYRRSLYTFWKRTAPPPSMEILNAPTREVFCRRL